MVRGNEEQIREAEASLDTSIGEYLSDLVSADDVDTWHSKTDDRVAEIEADDDESDASPLDFQELDEDELDQLATDVPDEAVASIISKFNGPAMLLARQTHRWLLLQDRFASDELYEAWRSLLLASSLAREAMRDAADDDVTDFSCELLDELSERIDEADLDEYDEAVAQAMEHFKSDRHLMQAALLECGMPR